MSGDGANVKRVALGLALAACGVLSTPATAPASHLPIVRPKGVGHLRLGSTARSLHRRHLIGRLRPGCELDPGQRVARLRAPLSGLAIFSHPNTKVRALSITGGVETAQKIQVGSSPREARDAYPRAVYEPPGTVPPFAEGFFWIPNIAHAKLTFTVDPQTKLISTISVPVPNFCE